MSVHVGSSLGWDGEVERFWEWMGWTADIKVIAPQGVRDGESLQETRWVRGV